MHFPFSTEPQPWPGRLTTLAAFLVPALALAAQSGYSYGAGLLLVGALLTLHRWPLARHDRLTWWFLFSTLARAALWVALADPQERLGGQWDRPVKFLLGGACLLFVAAYPPRPRALFAGLVVGCLGAGAVALWQVHVEGAPRASGFPSRHTNAIQWGNLALLMGAMLAAQGWCLRASLTRAWRGLALLGVLAAFHASALSQSRGGWLALLIAAPFGLWLLFRVNRRMPWAAAAWLAAAVAVVGLLNVHALTQRWDAAGAEVQIYDQQGDSATSVGQRLEHWRLAWDMGRERPLLGWGVAGYTAEKSARVAAGQYHPSILEYKYVHNELLDLFVKTGLLGVAVILVFYAVPLCMFWPTRARLAPYDARPGLRAQVLALRFAGLSIPVLYIGFGLTQVFFAHNSGIMFYLFMTMLVWAALLGVDRAAPSATVATR